MKSIQLMLIVLCGTVMREGHAWWPGYAGYPPPYPPPYPYYPDPPCGGSPCAEGPPKPPCPTPDPGPPNTTCHCPAAKACSIVLTPDHAAVDVPCGYGNQLIENFKVEVLNDTCGPQSYRFELALLYGALVDSFAGNFMTEPYVFFDPTTSNFYVNHSLIPDIMHSSSSSAFQSLAMKAYGLENSIVSQTVFITFTFRSCSLNLTGPVSTQMICPGRPPGSDPSRQYYTYPQLTFTVNNLPPGMPLVWDLPSDLGGQGASTAVLDAMGGVRMNSPMASSGTIPDGSSIWISNYNGFSDLSSATSPIGIYGASNKANPPNCTDYTVDYSGWMLPHGPCCQWLIFSVKPDVPSSFRPAGYTTVVCYEDPSSCTVA